MRLSGKTALVTGGNSGIGLAIARAFAADGAHVAISGRDRAALETARKAIGGNTVAVAADLTDVREIDRLAAEAGRALGRIDILVANAGYCKLAMIEDVTPEIFDLTIATNIRGTYFTVQKALPYLGIGSSVILVSSALGHLGVPGQSVYGATKAAIRALARSLGAELIGRGIRVNALSPGPVDTPIFDKMGLPREALDAHAANDVPIGRLGAPAEIASAAVFLASDDSSYMVGSELMVDGGHAQV